MPIDIRWNLNFELLKEYYEKYKTFAMKKEHKVTPSLKQWCVVQRQCYRSNDLSPERIKKLQSIGFFKDMKWIKKENA